MAILRASEIRDKDDDELDVDLTELRKNLMKIRGGLASGGIPEDVGKVREIKKTIARILTIKHERKLGLKRESKKAPVKPSKTEGPSKGDKEALKATKEPVKTSAKKSKSSTSKVTKNKPKEASKKK